MQKRYKVILSVLLIVAFSVIGANAAWMSTARPGTNDNPLISKGYLDRVLGIFRSEVQADIVAQQLKYEQLHNQYKGLEKEIADLKKIIADLSGSAPTQPTQPTNPTPPPTSTIARATIVVDAGTVNFRSSNNTNSSIIGTVRRGDEILALKYSDQWFQGTINGQTGWIAAWLVTSKTGHQLGHISSKLVNVRSGPSTNHSLITQLNLGDVVRITGEQGDWFKVVLNDGKEAWIFKPLLSRL